MTKEQVLTYYQECLEGTRNPRTPIHLQHWFRKYELVLPRRIASPLTETTLIEAESLCKQGFSFTEIAKKLSIKQSTIAQRLNQRGFTAIPQTILQRKHELNETFFDVIDTEEKAYFLGLLYADGNNSPERRTVKVSLNWKDKDLLEILNRYIHPTKSLRMVKARGTTEKMYGLEIYNKHISDTLIKHGLVPNKTHTLQFPEWLDKSLISHFIRGYFDGDGCITTNGMSIVGNIDFIIPLQNILMMECNLNKTKLSVRRPESPNIVTLNYGGRHSLNRLADYLYKDATVYMKRKYDKFQKFYK